MNSTQFASLIKFYNKTRQANHSKSITFSPTIISVRHMYKSTLEDQSLQNSFNKLNEVSTIWERVRKEPYSTIKEHHTRFLLSSQKLTPENKAPESLLDLKGKLNNTLKQYISTLQSTPKKSLNHRAQCSIANMKRTHAQMLMPSRVFR